MEPVSVIGNYIGTGAAQSIDTLGFKPSYLRIWNDTDNDVLFEAFQNHTDGYAIRVNSSGTFTPAALTLTGSTPAFTGTVPYTARTCTVTHDAAPGGNKIYLKYAAGRPYLASNVATDTVNKAVAFTGSEKLIIIHDAAAATAGLELMCTNAGVLQLNNTMSGVDEFVPLSGGALLKIAHNATPGTQSVYYDDGADERLEVIFGDAANHDITTEVQGWKTLTPAGTNAQVTVTGNSAGSVSGNITEITSAAVTFAMRGFDLGTDNTINESGKSYKFWAVR